MELKKLPGALFDFGPNLLIDELLDGNDAAYQTAAWMNADYQAYRILLATVLNKKDGVK